MQLGDVLVRMPGHKLWPESTKARSFRPLQFNTGYLSLLPGYYFPVQEEVYPKSASNRTASGPRTYQNPLRMRSLCTFQGNKQKKLWHSCPRAAISLRTTRRSCPPFFLHQMHISHVVFPSPKIPKYPKVGKSASPNLISSFPAQPRLQCYIGTKLHRNKHCKKSSKQHLTLEIQAGGSEKEIDPVTSRLALVVECEIMLCLCPFFVAWFLDEQNVGE